MSLIPARNVLQKLMLHEVLINKSEVLRMNPAVG